MDAVDIAVSVVVGLILVALCFAIGWALYRTIVPPDHNFEEFGARVDYLLCGSGSILRDSCTRDGFARNYFILHGREDEGIVFFNEGVDSIEVRDRGRPFSLTDIPGWGFPESFTGKRFIQNPFDSGTHLCRVDADLKVIEKSCIELRWPEGERLTVYTSLSQDSRHVTEPLSNVPTPFDDAPAGTYRQPYIPYINPVGEDVADEGVGFLVYMDFVPPESLYVVGVGDSSAPQITIRDDVFVAKGWIHREPRAYCFDLNVTRNPNATILGTVEEGIVSICDPTEEQCMSIREHCMDNNCKFAVGVPDDCRWIDVSGNFQALCVPQTECEGVQ